MVDTARGPSGAVLVICKTRGGMARGLGVQIVGIAEIALRSRLLLGDNGNCRRWSAESGFGAEHRIGNEET
jgi:hypothetical protein